MSQILIGLAGIFVLCLSFYKMGYCVGYEACIDKNKDEFTTQCKYIRDKMSLAEETLEEARDMKMHFLEMVHKKITVKVAIKDEKDVEIETHRIL